MISRSYFGLLLGSTRPYIQIRRAFVAELLIDLGTASASAIYDAAKGSDGVPRRGVEYPILAFDLDIVGLRVADHPKQWISKHGCICGSPAKDLVARAMSLLESSGQPMEVIR